MENQEKTTAEKIIQKIEQDKVAPIAKWHFVLKNSSFWALWLLSVVLGSCAVAATIFVFLNSGWTFRSVTHDSFFKFILDVIPFFWIISLGLMIVFGYFNIRHTKKGYRFSFYLIIILSVVASFIGGTLIYAAGIAKNIDNIRRPIPFAKPIMSVREDRWVNPGAGLLAGTVESLDEDNQILSLKLFKGEEIEISTKELREEDFDLIEEGQQIRIIGGPDISDKDIFVACTVLPWDIQSQPINPKPKNTIERKINPDRINTCEGVRPYKKYREILITN
ncbi:hypothetical protein IT402_01955 [Candidatus Nomurabacteria bacterium]|nr:hypothetical protein [Candidatus Nomurabacteria bacterium]